MLISTLTSMVFLAVFFGLSAQDDGQQKHWALLVAGSMYYLNYRHQADVCHAYHIVRKHGIPPEQIVVMMYDDIAYNVQNPFLGNIINEPNGTNVYPGVSKEYTGEEVLPEVFLKVLSGDEAGVEKLIKRKEKVIKSGPNDTVFVYFSDHGGAGLLFFPDNALFADDFNKVLKKMHQNKQYGKMVIYVEACESGSMFKNLLDDNINIYVTTAANPDEESQACFFDDKRNTYVGDVYSYNWMEDSEVENLNQESLHKQFEIVKKETNTSHVQQYGDISLSKLKVADFQGDLDDKTRGPKPVKKHDPNADAVRSEDVPYEILKRKGDTEGMQRLIQLRDSTRRFFQEVVVSVSKFDYWTLHSMPLNFTDFKCYKESIAQINRVCPGMKLYQNDYAMRSLRVLANLCEQDVDMKAVWTAIQDIASISPLCRIE